MEKISKVNQQERGGGVYQTPKSKQNVPGGGKKLNKSEEEYYYKLKRESDFYKDNYVEYKLIVMEIKTYH